MRKSSLLAAASLAILASSSGSDALGSFPENSRIPYPKGWNSKPSHSGNNRREDSAKRHAKAKAAYKSKRAQRKKAKR